jgi:hypothetical protein
MFPLIYTILCHVMVSFEVLFISGDSHFLVVTPFLCVCLLVRSNLIEIFSCVALKNKYFSRRGIRLGYFLLLYFDLGAGLAQAV